MTTDTAIVSSASSCTVNNKDTVAKAHDMQQQAASNSKASGGFTATRPLVGQCRLLDMRLPAGGDGASQMQATHAKLETMQPLLWLQPMAGSLKSSYASHPGRTVK
jgi:hypothetical protein